MTMAALAGFATAFAQDTLTMFDTFYMYNYINEAIAPVDCKIMIDSELYRAEELPWFQMYIVPVPTTIYGVAVTPYNDTANRFSNCIDWDSPHPEVDLIATVYAKEGPNFYVIADSVRCEATPYRGHFWYQTVDWNGVAICDIVEFREYYFEYPCTVYDTCFIGVRIDNHHGELMPLAGLVNLAMEFSNSPNAGVRFLATDYYDACGIFNPCGSFSLGNGTLTSDTCVYNVSRAYGFWGGTFPIVGFHCTTPPQNIRREEISPDHCTLAWDGNAGGVYEVAVGRYGDSPDTVSRRYVTTDTVLRLDSLEYGTLYSVWVRGQCHYATAAYDTVIWSNWGSTYISLPLSIEEANATMLDVTPNPTDGMVRIGAEGVKEVWCVSADGRRTRLKVKNGQVSLKSQPAGLYVLEIQTAEGLYTAKVVRR